MSEPGGDRRLTVSRLYEQRKPFYPGGPKEEQIVPFLRMRGQWLGRLGFCPGSRVRVQAQRGRLVLTLDSETEGA
jgi:hypothetical protein